MPLKKKRNRWRWLLWVAIALFITPILLYSGLALQRPTRTISQQTLFQNGCCPRPNGENPVDTARGQETAAL